MTIDIRATTTCNLGPLISASISDDYVQNNGLIKTSGNCELAALVSPRMGTNIVFQYTINGITRKIPRVLKVLSSFADPFRRTTSIEFGCPLTYMQDVTEPIKLDALGDPINDSLTQEDANRILFSISAQYIGKKCLDAIGVEGDLPLENKFTLDQPFNLSSGYVNVLSDLLVSESYCGYIGTDGKLKVFSLADSTGKGRVVTENEIIDVGPLNFGDLPGDTVTVSYSTLRLVGAEDEEDALDPDRPEPEEEEDPIKATPEQQAKLDWESEILEDELQTISLSGTLINPPEGSNGKWSFEYPFRPYTWIVAEYDAYDRIIKRTTRTYGILAQVNAEYAVQYINFFGLGASGIGSQSILTVKEEYKFYKQQPPDPEIEKGTTEAEKEEGSEELEKPSPEIERKQGYDEVINEISVTYAPEVVAMSGCPAKFIGYDTSGNAYFDELELTLPVQGNPTDSLAQPDIRGATEIISTFYETYARELYASNQSNGYFPSTKTVTLKRRIFAQTARGKEYFKGPSEEGLTIRSRPGGPSSPTIISIMKTMVSDGSSTRIVNGREAVLEARPRATERITARRTEKEEEGTQETTSESSRTEDSGPRTEETTEIELIYTNYDIGRKIEFTMPYAPDDIFVALTVGASRVYRTVKSSAAQKAALFGRTQNSLLMGNRNGISLQLAASSMPSEPFSKIAVQARGVTGIYATNGTSWTIDSNGIIASTDALLLGAAGKA